MGSRQGSALLKQAWCFSSSRDLAVATCGALLWEEEGTAPADAALLVLASQLVLCLALFCECTADMSCGSGMGWPAGG